VGYSQALLTLIMKPHGGAGILSAAWTNDQAWAPERLGPHRSNSRDIVGDFRLFQIAGAHSLPTLYRMLYVTVENEDLSPDSYHEFQISLWPPLARWQRELPKLINKYLKETVRNVCRNNDDLIK
jgi:hypothetical protein